MQDAPLAHIVKHSRIEDPRSEKLKIHTRLYDEYHFLEEQTLVRGTQWLPHGCLTELQQLTSVMLSTQRQQCVFIISLVVRRVFHRIIWLILVESVDSQLSYAISF